MLAAVLRQRMAVAASERSFNNEIGVPLTLLGAPDGTEAVVVEMGARGVGHIAHLCSIALPTVGIVTRVAAVHTEAFGTVNDVARAKSELVAALPPTGTAVLRSEEHTSEIQSIMRISYAVFCLKKTTTQEIIRKHDIEVESTRI